MTEKYFSDHIVWRIGDEKKFLLIILLGEEVQWLFSDRGG